MVGGAINAASDTIFHLTHSNNTYHENIANETANNTIGFPSSLIFNVISPSLGAQNSTELQKKKRKVYELCPGCPITISVEAFDEFNNIWDPFSYCTEKIALNNEETDTCWKVDLTQTITCAILLPSLLLNIFSALSLEFYTLVATGE